MEEIIDKNSKNRLSFFAKSANGVASFHDVLENVGSHRISCGCRTQLYSPDSLQLSIPSIKQRKRVRIAHITVSAGN
jgi:hypothetical protein